VGYLPGCFVLDASFDDPFDESFGCSTCNFNIWRWSTHQKKKVLLDKHEDAEIKPESQWNLDHLTYNPGSSLNQVSPSE
jgi:hypothetical protein